MVEQGQLPEGYERLIKKLEQFFMIKLIESKESKPRERRKTPAEEIVINARTAQELTIADLRRIKQEREKQLRKEESTEKEEKSEPDNEANPTTQHESLLGSDIEIIED